MRTSNLLNQDSKINCNLLNFLQEEAIKTIRLKAQLSKLTGKSEDVPSEGDLLDEISKKIHFFSDDREAMQMFIHLRFINKHVAQLIRANREIKKFSRIPA